MRNSTAFLNRGAAPPAHTRQEWWRGSTLRAMLVLTALLCFAHSASAQTYISRFTTTTNGAVTFTGNTLGLNKVAGQNNPGGAGSIGAFITTNTILQVGTYPAGTTLNWTQDSSSAVLVIPSGSTVLYAELIWGGGYSYGGTNVSGSLGSSVSFSTPAGSSSVAPTGVTSQTLGAASGTGTCNTAPCFYVRSANVTALVAAAGAGTYTVGGVPATVSAAEDNANNAGWTLAVVYGNSALPARNMTVYVGAVATVSGATPVTVSGFCTSPTGKVSGRLAVSALEGDSGIIGDQMNFGPTLAGLIPLSGPNNAVGNFFASQINDDAGALNTTGSFGAANQPQNSFSTGRQGYDITNVDISSTLTNAETSAVAEGTTTGDNYMINALGLQINVGSPSFPVTTKSVNHATTYVGDTLTYTIVLNNTAGTADATSVTFLDPPPAGTVFVANSLTIGGVVQVGANPTSGVSLGTIAAGSSKTVTFQVTVTSLPVSPAGAQYANSANWTYQYVPCSGQAIVNGTLTTNQVVTSVARLVPIKAVSPSTSVSSGEILTYTITVPNSGTANSAGTTLADAIPTGTSYVAGSTKLNGVTMADVAGAMPFISATPINSPTRPAGQINTGETAAVTFQVAVTAGASGSITNTATIDVDGAGPAPAVTAQVISLIATLIPAKTVSPGGTVTPGQVLTYTIAVPNSGTGNTAGTTLADAIPAGLTYLAGSTTLNGGAVTDVAGAMPFVTAAQINSPTRPAGQINAGETATIVFKATVNSSPGAGPIVNTASIDPDGAGPAPIVTAQASSAIILPDLVMAKSHSGSFAVGNLGSYTLQVTVASGGGPVNGGPITVTDSLPSGLTVAALPTGTNWNCASTVIGSASASCTYSGSYPVTAGIVMAPITLTVNVAAAAAPSVTNTVTATAVPGETNTANNTATDLTVVLSKPSIAKAFSAITIPVGGTVTLTLTVTNNSTSALTGVAFSDAFPTGLIVAATPALTNTCGGAISGASSGSASLGLTGGALNASASCAVSVAVTAPAGSYANTASGVSSTETGAAGAASNSATLGIVPSASIAKAFNPSVMGIGGTATLNLVLSNPAATAQAGVAFADTYPAGLVNASPANVTNTCGGAISGGTLGGNSIGLSGGTIAGGSTCTITVAVTAGTAGSYANGTSAVTSTNGGTGNSAAATLTVLLKPTIAKSFAPTAVAPGSTSTLTLVISNANALPLTGLSFNDAFPAGLQIAAAPALTNSCTGTVTGGTAGAASLGLTGGVIAASASCTLTVTVTAAASGNYTNTSSGVTSNEAGSSGPASNSALLSVLTAPSIAKAFSPTVIATSSTATLTLTLSNANSAALTGVAFSDSYPAGLTNAALPSATNNCGGTVNGAVSSGTTIGLSGGTIPANGNCTVTVNVTSTGNGTYNNTTGVVTATNASNGNAASATLSVAGNPIINKIFLPRVIATGTPSAMTLTITNNFPIPLTGIAFSDAFPSGLTVATSPGLSNTCGGSISGGASGGNSVGLSNGALAANASCAVTVNVTAATSGSYANTTGAVSSTQTGTASPSNTAILQVLTPPTITKSFNPASILVNGTTTLTFVIANPNGIGLTGLAFTDAFPTGLMVSSFPTVSNNCGGTFNGATAGSTTISLSGGSLASGSGTTCAISLQVTSATPGSLTNTTSGVSSTQASTGAGSNASILVVVAPDLTLSKTHSGSFTVGSPGGYNLVVNNQGTGATVGTITVTDTLPTGLSYVAAGSGGAGWSCAAVGQTVTCTSTAVIAAGSSGAPIAINVAVSDVAVPSVTNNAAVGGGGEPAVYSGNNSAADFTVISGAVVNTFLTDGQQTGLAGTSVFYTHTFNVGIAGSVSFSATDVPTPNIPGWTNLIYRDTNCNGALDGAESNAPLTGPTVVAPGTRLCVIVKVFIPATAPYSAQDQLTIAAVFTPTAPGSTATYTHSDLTTVGSSGGAGLSLQKSVRNVTSGGPTGTSNTAISGQVLEYTITYTNNATAPLSAITLNDTTPAYSIYASALCGTIQPSNITACTVSTQPAVGSSGPIAWTLTGSLLPAAAGTVLFRVVVQ